MSVVKAADRLSTNLLRLSNDKIEDKRRDYSVATTFPYLIKDNVFPSRMIIPLQDSLTCTLPTSADTINSHDPFPHSPPEIAGESAHTDLADGQPLMTGWM
jgi:serine/threonine-protein kinase ATR